MATLMAKIGLPLALWLLKSFFGKMERDNDAKKSFLLFIDAMERNQLAGVELNDADRSQLEELKARRASMETRQSENTWKTSI